MLQRCQPQLCYCLPNQVINNRRPYIVSKMRLLRPLNHVSPLFRKNAELLLNKMLQSRDITSWNELGEFFYNGDIIQGTNMLDLVRSATQIHKLHKEELPQGWYAFMNTMAKLNIPSVVIAKFIYQRRSGHSKNDLTCISGL